MYCIQNENNMQHRFSHLPSTRNTRVHTVHKYNSPVCFSIHWAFDSRSCHRQDRCCPGVMVTKEAWYNGIYGRHLLHICQQPDIITSTCRVFRPWRDSRHWVITIIYSFGQCNYHSLSTAIYGGVKFSLPYAVALEVTSIPNTQYTQYLILLQSIKYTILNSKIICNI